MYTLLKAEVQREGGTDGDKPLRLKLTSEQRGFARRQIPC